MGLSQGLFTVAQDGSTDPAVTRTASHETMLDHITGRVVHDQALTMPLSGLKAQIAAFTGASTSTTLAPQGSR
jgi:hypothetical protein